MRVAVLGVLIVALGNVPAWGQEAKQDSASDKLLARCIRILKFGEKGRLQTSRQDAVIALGLLGDERAVPVLIEFLQNDMDDTVRYEIVQALGRMKAVQALPALRKALCDDSDIVRARAADVLGVLGDKTVVATVEKMLEDKSVQVRCAAGFALAKFAEERSLAPIGAALLKEKEQLVRFVLIGTLADYNSAAAVPVLESMLNHADRNVQSEARLALERITGKSYREPPQP